MARHERPTEILTPRRAEFVDRRQKSRVTIWRQRAGGLLALAALFGGGYKVVEYTQEGKTVHVVPDTPARTAPRAAPSPKLPPAVTTTTPAAAPPENRGTNQDTQPAPQSSDPTNSAGTIGEIKPQPVAPADSQFQPHD